MPGAPPWGGRAPHPHGPLKHPLTYFFLLCISTYPENIQEHHEKLFPPPQPSVSVRSHLGAFGQRTSSWHITDMWDRSVSKPISIDSKMANPPFLERDEEREHTDGLARRPRYIRAWLIDIIITCWAAVFRPSPE